MRVVSVLALSLAVALAAVHQDLDNVNFGLGEAMKLQLLTDYPNAICLDGTPAGFYFAPATKSEFADKWQIYFQGGGWCYDEMDCYGRSSTNLGSSKSWSSTSSIGGIMSDDCTVNPDFCNFNRVHMAYCDGNSFSGNRSEPIVVNGKNIYFRGLNIIDATFTALKKLGLASASEVLLTGCSAGGLATYLHADYVGELLQGVPVQKYKAVSISGFFLHHKTVENKLVYPDEMKYIYNLSNAKAGLNQDCVAAHPDDAYLCNFASYTYEHIKTPFFPLNSALDSWQTRCIFTSEYVSPNSTANGDCGAAAGYESCASNPESCNSSQILNMIQYEKDFISTMTSSDTFKKDGNGAFVYSCHTHCAGQSGAYNTFKIGNYTMQQAVSKWWNGDTEPAAANSHLPCIYNTAAPYRCNPTCGSN